MLFEGPLYLQKHSQSFLQPHLLPLSLSLQPPPILNYLQFPKRFVHWPSGLLLLGQWPSHNTLLADSYSSSQRHLLQPFLPGCPTFPPLCRVPAPFYMFSCSCEDLESRWSETSFIQVSSLGQDHTSAPEASNSVSGMVDTRNECCWMSKYTGQFTNTDLSVAHRRTQLKTEITQSRIISTINMLCFPIFNLIFLFKYEVTSQPEVSISKASSHAPRHFN